MESSEDKILTALSQLQASNDALSVSVENMRAEVNDLKGIIRALNLPKSEALDDKQHLLQAIFSVSGLERKPYSLTLRGIIDEQMNLSAMRTAIMLVVLMDLQDRSEGGKGIAEPSRAILSALRELQTTDSDDEQLYASIRVGLYRFDDFQKGFNLFSGAELPLSYEAKRCRLDVIPEQHGLNERDVTVVISSADSAINKIVDAQLTSSPLTRLRKQGVLYLPGGIAGVDKLVLEIFSQTEPVSQVAVFHRPSLQSFPLDLLERTAGSEQKVERTKLVLEGYESGRCKFVEIVSRAAMKNLLQCNSEGRFASYPADFGKKEVTSHFEHLVWLLRSFENYQLILTDAYAPFHLTTYEISPDSNPECFTLFLRRASTEFTVDETCFAVEGQYTKQSITERVVSWITAHPSTSVNRAATILELESLRDSL